MPTQERGKLADSRIEGAFGDYASLPMFREVLPMPAWLVIPVLIVQPLAALFVLLTLGRNSAPLAVLTAVVLLAGTVVIWIFRRLVVQAQPLALEFGFGPFSRSLPYAGIGTAEAVPYSVWRYGGWGWRLGFDGSVAYSVIGQKQAVRVCLKSTSWPRVYVITVGDPSALIECVEKRRDAARGQNP